jgi:GWxTD domain-containing protein
MTTKMINRIGTCNTKRWPLLFGLSFLLIFCPFDASHVEAKEIKGQGDFEIYFDEAVFLRHGGKLIQEIYVRILNSEIKFNPVDKEFQAKLGFEIVIQDEKGQTRVNDSFTLDLVEEDQEKIFSPVDFQTVIKRYELTPGKYYISCSVTDLMSPKATVVGMIGKRHKTSKVQRMVIHVPPLASEAVTISDVLYLWGVEHIEGREVYHPNPVRMYGLYKDSLEVYLEVYLPQSMTGGEVLHVEAVVLDEKGEELIRSIVPLELGDAPKMVSNPDGESSLLRLPVLIKEDLNILPAGSYALYTNIVLDERLIGRFRCGMFSVAWDLRTWESSRRTYLAEARFLLGDKEFREFLNKSLGDQEKMLHELWEKQDPTPDSGANEAYEEFIVRLNYVNTHYSDYQYGSFTDRGLIYMKFGPPDETIAEVIPVNRESVTDALEKIDNRFHPVTFSSHGVRGAYDMPTKDVIIDPRRIGAVGEGGNVAYPFELWIYNKSGQPILERDRTLEPDIGLRFIFIDREGYGRYKLESSSSMTDK